MENLDIKDFQSVSSVNSGDNILLARQNGSHGKMSVDLFKKAIINGLTPSIRDGVWFIGENSTNTKATGRTPQIEIGYVTSVSNGSEATVKKRYNGVDNEGNPIYLFDFEIPRGKDGITTDIDGNPIQVDWESVLNKPSWIDSPTKPEYTASEVGALPSNTSFKTINGESILGEGEITIKVEAGGVGQNYGEYPNAEIFNDYENNIANGAHAHAEGRETNATGNRAHAEGYKTSVFAVDAHAEGRETWCTGAYGHVEGYLGFCSGGYSHTEGGVEKDSFLIDTKKIINSEEEIRDFFNLYTTPVRIGTGEGVKYNSLEKSFFEQYYIHGSFGLGSHAEGINNVVCDKAGHVEGYNNICGNYIPGMNQDKKVYAPHAEGIGNRIESLLYAAHVGGGYNHIKSGHYTFAHGFNLSIENDLEVSFGQYNTSSINGKKVLFSYGVGYSDNMRKNAFSVLEDGTFVCESIQTLLDGFTNKIKLLQDTINNQQKQIDELIELIQSGSGGGRKAFVLNEKLIFTEYISVDVKGNTLTITDNAVKVENGVLIIK